MAKKAKNIAKSEIQENPESLTPPIENPKLLAKLQKLAADSGISVQDLVNLKLDELRHGVAAPAEKTTQPAEPKTTVVVPNDTSRKVMDIVERATKVMQTLEFLNQRDVAIAEQMIKIIQLANSL